MTIDRRLLAGVLGLTLIVAACGGSSTPTSGAGNATPAPDATAEPTEAPEATEATEATEAPEATEEPQPSEEATSNNSLGGEMNDLARLLPETAGDVTFERAGFDGDQLGIYGAAAGLNSEELDPILKANGKTLNDVNFAIATSSTSEMSGMIYAIQIEGIPATTFAEGMGQDLSSTSTTTLGGKTVYGEAAGGFGFFAYPKDDMLFILLMVDEATAGKILEQLP
jgi:hypothetical protein